MLDNTEGQPVIEFAIDRTRKGRVLSEALAAIQQAAEAGLRRREQELLAAGFVHMPTLITCEVGNIWHAVWDRFEAGEQ